MSSDQTHANGASEVRSLAPLSQEWELTNGRGVVVFEMPDMLKFADGSFDIPNSYQADIFELIYGNGTMSSAMAQLVFNRQKLRGLYALFSLVCVKPKFVIDNEDRQVGEIGPQHVGWIDVLAAYNFFRFGPTRAFSTTTGEDASIPETIVTATQTSE